MSRAMDSFLEVSESLAGWTAGAVTVLEPPRDEAQAVACLERYRQLLADVRRWEDAWKVVSAAEGLKHHAAGLDVGKAVIANAAELLFDARCRLGELLGKGKEGRQTGSTVNADGTVTAPSGAVKLDRHERQRCRALASIPREEREAYKRSARLRYLADDARLGLYSPRTILRYFGLEGGKGRAVHIIKPSDNWNFSRPYFDRLPGVDLDSRKHGYIPGDLYANVLWYWSLPGDRVVCPMAGSGMIFHVYERRDVWMGDQPWELDLRGADLNPRGPYKDRIAQRDACEEIEGRADLIVADIPYFGMCEKQYSKNPRDMGNMDWPTYRDMLPRLAANCRRAQPHGGRTVIITPRNFRDHKAGRRVSLDRLVIAAFEAAGYVLVDSADATRRIQQRQDPTMAHLNNVARETRTMLSDMSAVLCFEAPPAGR